MIHDTPYDDPKLNGTLQSELWNLIDADRGIILMDQEHIDELGLDDSQSFPWDPSKKVYLVNAYHQLHCLVSLMLQTNTVCLLLIYLYRKSCTGQ